MCSRSSAWSGSASALVPRLAALERLTEKLVPVDVFEHTTARLIERLASLQSPTPKGSSADKRTGNHPDVVHLSQRLDTHDAWLDQQDMLIRQLQRDTQRLGFSASRFRCIEHLLPKPPDLGLIPMSRVAIGGVQSIPVRIDGLSKSELNRRIGLIVDPYDQDAERVAVKFLHDGVMRRVRFKSIFRYFPRGEWCSSCRGFVDFLECRSAPCGCLGDCLPAVVHPGDPPAASYMPSLPSSSSSPPMASEATRPASARAH